MTATGLIRYDVPLISLNTHRVKTKGVHSNAKNGINRLLADTAFRNDFIAMLMRKQRYLAERVALLAATSAEERLLGFLDEHCGGRRETRLSFSKKDVAAAIGAAPETLSRLIRRLEKKKVLAWKGRTVVRADA